MTPLYALASWFRFTMKKGYFIAPIMTTLIIAGAVTTASVLAQPLAGQGGNNATSMTTTGQQQPPVYITKSGTNTYVLSGQMSSIGSFDTTYRVVGERNALRTQENLTISTIASDFKASPTIGYIRVSNLTTTTANATALPNPFATPEAITEKIRSELTNTIDEAENNTSQGQYVEIFCSFHMSLDDIHCHYNPLAGTEPSTTMMPSH